MLRNQARRETCFELSCDGGTISLVLHPNVAFNVEPLDADVFQFLCAVLHKGIVLNGDRELEFVSFPFAGATVVQVLGVLVADQRVRTTSGTERCRRVLTMIEVVIKERKVSIVQ